MVILVTKKELEIPPSSCDQAVIKARIRMLSVLGLRETTTTVRGNMTLNLTTITEKKNKEVE